MKPPAIPENEAERLAALDDYAILDTPAEECFDALSRLVRHILQVPVALVSLVDRERQWFKSKSGWGADESPRETSFCGHVVASGNPLTVEDASSDERFFDNPLVISEPNIRFYAASPLQTPSGLTLGTLCAIDYQPRKLSKEQHDLLDLLAKQATSLLELRRQERRLQLQHTELRTQSARLQAVFEGMAEGVVMHDASGAIGECNGPAEAILGLTKDQLMGRTPIDPRWRSVRDDGSPFPGEEHPASVTLRTGEVQSNVIMGVHKPTGELSWISINSLPLPASGGEAPGVVATFRDVTAQRAMEEERLELKERLMRQERLVTMGTLAAGVGHEINNPLSFVSANVDLALEELRRMPAMARRDIIAALEDARAGADRIQQVVQGLRALARDDGTLTPTELREVIELSVRMTRSEIQSRASLHVEPLPELLVAADAGRLSQVLVNILINAAQAFAEAAPESNRVSVRVSSENDQVRIDISDNGAGISDDALPHIFDPFFTTKPVGTGTGLGLAISHAIVRSFGGELSVESAEGEGTTFRIELQQMARDSSAPQTPAPGRCRVLVIDDEEAMCRLCLRILEDTCDVVTESSSKRAWGRLEAGESFDVVVCDLVMPELTGMQLLQRAEALDPDLGRRIIFMTGGTADSDVVGFLAQTTNPTLEKPFSPQQLRVLVHDSAKLPA